MNEVNKYFMKYIYHLCSIQYCYYNEESKRVKLHCSVKCYINIIDPTRINSVDVHKYELHLMYGILNGGILYFPYS